MTLAHMSQVLLLLQVADWPPMCSVSRSARPDRGLHHAVHDNPRRGKL
jgi:hypothetical protein